MRTLKLLICLLASAKGFAQPPSTIFFKKLTQEQGLSKNSIWSTYRDKTGFLWLATSNGLNRYDGSTVTVFKKNASVSHSIPSNTPRYITEDAEGKLWMSSESKIFFLNKKNYNFTDVDISRNGRISALSHLISCSDGNIYAGQGRYLISINSKTLKQRLIKVEKDSSLNKSYGIYHFTEDKDGWLWFSNYPNLYAYHLQTGKVKKYPVLPSMLNNVEAIEAGSIIDDGDFLWLGMYSSGGFAKFDKRDGSIIFFPAEGYQTAYAVTAAATDGIDSNYIWVGTKMLGLGLFEKSSLRFIRFYNRDDSRQGSILSNNITASIEFDKDKTCWVSTSDGLGYFNLRNQTLQTVYIEPYRGKNFNRYEYEYIVKDKTFPNQLYISTKDKGIIKYDVVANKIIYKQPNSTGNAEDQYKEHFIEWMNTDADNVLWYASLKGVFTLKGNASPKKVLDITRFANNNSQRTQVFEACMNDKGQLWFAASTGLWRYEKATGIFAFSDTTIPELKQSFSFIIPDSKNQLWLISGNHSIVCYNPETGKAREWKIYTDPEKKNKLIPIRLVTDKYGNPWISSVEGLATINVRNDSIHIFKEADGFCSSIFLQLAYNGADLIFGGTENCICEINIDTKTIENYDLNEGLLDNTVRGGFLADGDILWVGGRNYLQKMDINHNSFKYAAPLLFSSIEANDKVVFADSSNHLRLQYSQNNLQIDYRLLDMLNESDYEYEYRLQKFNEEWIKAGDINKALFLNLPAGKFTFEVRALNRKSSAILASAKLQIFIATPWWQTWWFRVLCAFAFAGILYYFYNQRIDKLLAVERTRQRIGKDLHDDIGTTLSSITLMNTLLKKKIKSQPDEAVRLADKVETTSREMIQNMSDIVWSINPGNDTLEKLINRLQQFMNDAFENSDAIYELKVSPDLETKKIGMETRKDAYLICKEIISNAAKYSSATGFSLHLNTLNHSLLITAEDNGVGFDTKKEKTGNGLTNIQLRTQKHKGVCNYSSAPGKGTRWSIQLKI